MVKKKYNRYSSEFKRHVLKRASECTINKIWEPLHR